MSLVDQPIYLTPKGVTELEEELAHLQNVKRPQTLERIQEAKGGSDWMDNTEYLLIQEELAFVDGRIQEILYALDNAQLIEAGNEDNIVDIGETVIIQAEDGEEEKYTIVGRTEADPGAGLISNESPLGKALLDHKVGEHIVVQTPAGDIRYHILAINKSSR